MILYHFMWLSVLWLVLCRAQEPPREPQDEKPIRLTTEKPRLTEEVPPQAPPLTETAPVTDETADLKRRIEALELLVAEQTNRRAQMKKVVGFVEKGTVSTISYLQKKLAQGAPDTDEECSYDYVVGRCVPVCDCKLQPKLGDYSLTRACRLVESEGSSDGNELAPPPCDPSTISMTPWIVRLSKTIMRWINKVIEHVKTHAPPTDEECSYKPLAFSCQPSDTCGFDFQFGDYSLHRACRLKDEAEGEEAGSIDTNKDPLKSHVVEPEDKMSPHAGHAHTEDL